MQILQTVYTDRERVNERKDCTVRALAAVTGWDYLYAHSIARQYGRRDGKGFDPRPMLAGLSKEGFDVREVPVQQPHFVERTAMRYYKAYDTYLRSTRRVRTGETVASFLARCPRRGRFYVCSSSHAFAVVDGRVLDMGRIQTRAKMHFAYEVTPQAKPEVKTDLTQSDLSAMWERLNKIESKL